MKASLMEYQFSEEYSEPDEAYLGLCNQFPHVSSIAETKSEAIIRVLRLIADSLSETDSEF